MGSDDWPSATQASVTYDDHYHPALDRYYDIKEGRIMALCYHEGCPNRAAHSVHIPWQDSEGDDKEESNVAYCTEHVIQTAVAIPPKHLSAPVHVHLNHISPQAKSR